MDVQTATTAAVSASAGAGGLTVAQVFRDHAPFVWRALRRLGVREADVEDVCQEVFVVVHRRLADFEGRSSVRTWVYGICVRVASDWRKRAHVRREMLAPKDEGSEKELDAPPSSRRGLPRDPGAEVARREARAILDGILDQLDEDKRAVFVLYEIEQLTMNEVAEAIGCPLQTAYSRLHAARKIVEAQIAVAAGRQEGARA